MNPAMLMIDRDQPRPRRSPFGEARLIKARDRSVLKGGSIRKVKDDFVYITPTPVFRWIITLNDRVRSGAKMFGRMPVR